MGDRLWAIHFSGEERFASLRFEVYWFRLE